MPELTQDEIKAHHAQLEAKLPPGWTLFKVRDYRGDLWDGGNDYYGHDSVFIEVDKDNWFYNDPMGWPIAANKLNLGSVSGIIKRSSNLTGQWQHFISVSLFRTRYTSWIKDELAKIHDLITSPRPSDL
jgi:hypothetical protein